MARVRLAGVSKRYPNGVVALDRLDLTVDDEELVVIVGPSGSGKTSLLRLIAGLERPTEGEVRIGERVVTHLSPRERDVAYLPQSCPLYPHKNVFDNIALGGRMRHAATLLTPLWRRLPWLGSASSEAETPWTKTTEVALVQQAAKKLGIGHLLERWPRQLSGGERQRVALARAIVRKPAVFLFDEPLSSLDSHLRNQLRRELHHLPRETGKATLYVTHDQAEALTLAQRLVVLDRGRIQQIGPPEELYDRPQNRFVASFLGFPPMNLLAGKVQRTAQDWSFSAGPWQIELSSAAAERLINLPAGVEMGVRPEGIELQKAGPSYRGNQGEVTLAESLGDVRLVYLQADAQTLVAKVPAASHFAVGQTVAWHARWSSLHWFDRATQLRVEI
jgi:ABC-type sugar transport system ATPase subunit